MSIFIIFAAVYLYLVILLIGAAVFFLSSQFIRKQMLLLSLIVFPVSYLVGKVLNLVIQSPRPFVLEHITPIIQASRDNGFPSDHTLLSMTVASIVFAYNRNVGILLFVLAVCVGVARVLLRVHHPIDITGSTVIAVVVTYVVYLYLTGKRGRFVRPSKNKRRK
jgi:undecaprenyl-diphosphatase